MAKKLDISVVVPAWRTALTIGRTLTSCLREVEPQQITVVLDGADATLENAARKAAPDAVIKVRSDKPGAPACRNFGLALSHATYVMFLDSDDYVEGGLLAASIAAADATGADVVLGTHCREYPDASREMRDPSRLYPSVKPEAVLKRWLAEDYTPPCAVVWRADFVRRLGGWDEALAKNQDGDLMLRALMCGARIAVAKSGLGVYTQSPNPNRITMRNNRSTLESQMKVLNRVNESRPLLTDDPAKELSQAYYAIAKVAYTIGVFDIGERAEAAARKLGLTGQPGSTGHTLLASLFGLKGKQRIAAFARNCFNV